MAPTLPLAIIAFIFGMLGINEFKFNSNARQFPATIVEIFTAVRTGESVPLGERDIEIAKKATVKLEGLTDNREGAIVIPVSVWEGLRVDDTLKVWAFAEKLKWVFWSPMTRYNKRNTWVQVNVSIMAVFLMLAFLSHILSID